MPPLFATVLPALLAAVSALGGTCQKVIVTGDPAYPPFVRLNGQSLSGIAIDIVGKALDRIKLAHETRYAGPFPRMLASAKDGSVDIVAELKRNSEREGFLAFTKTPIFTNPIAVFVVKGRKLDYKSWNDLVGLRGGITLGNKFGGGFDEFLATKLTVETALTIESNFAKLEHGRIDYFVTAYYPGISGLIRDKLTDRIVALRPFIASTANFVGWSKASACLDRLGAFDKALGELARSGEIEKMIHAGLAPDASPR